MKLIIDIPEEQFITLNAKTQKEVISVIDHKLLISAIRNGTPVTTDVNEKLTTERPQGEWIITGEEQGAVGMIYKIRKCNKCGWEHSLVIPDNFCPNCGADMRGEEND